MHCYIFDYSIGSIYHCRLPSNLTQLEDIEKYLSSKGFKMSNISYLLSDKELKIKEV